MNSTLSSRRASGNNRSSIALSISIALSCGLLLAAPAAAQSINLKLNVLYDQPATPATSGGNWQLLAKSSSPGTFGIFALDVYLRNIVTPPSLPVGPRGIVNGNDPAGFGEFDVFSPTAGVVELIIGQAPVSLQPGEEQSVFYGVGTLANGEPGQIGPVFSSLTDTAAIPWATGDVLGEPGWGTGALLASGTFLAGVEPAFNTTGGFISTGRVFTSLGSSLVVGTRTAADMPLVATTLVDRNMAGNGDYNHDHVVNAADYTVWRNSLGVVGAGLPADGNSNGMIDNGDFEVWKLNFGNSVPGAGGGSGSLTSAGAVPEPATASLLLGAQVLLFLRRKTRVFRYV